ncbi:MAG: serine/threonine kinase [Ignavibacteria bacterium]|nr:serine/threonine kinase [Ignavibacteria bacterium]
MKRKSILIALTVFFIANLAFSQTMKVQTKSGEKTYNVGDVQSITFGKTITGAIEMVEIPAGTFQMGQISIAEPVHTVNITKAFYMGKYEVTQKQYTDVIGSNPSQFAGKPTNPVEQVNWYDAVQFCNELSKKEDLELCYTLEGGTTWRCDFDKKGYRLPTEAEWEYSCRAGTLTDYYTGTTESQLASAGWYDYNSNNTTHPVGLKVANKFGLYDMHGNVWEWCWDWSAIYIAVTFDDTTWPNSGSYRVLRGGSWLNNNATHCCSAYHSGDFPVSRFSSLGFRVVMTK